MISQELMQLDFQPSFLDSLARMNQSYEMLMQHLTVVVDPAGNVEIFPASGLLLGLVDDFVYTPGAEVELAPRPGDILLLFSDGLSEAQNAAVEFYGKGPLQRDVAGLAGIRGQEFLETLADLALAFGFPEYRDDLTVLGITRLP